jgi:hypothetical protein
MTACSRIRLVTRRVRPIYGETSRTNPKQHYTSNEYAVHPLVSATYGTIPTKVFASTLQTTRAVRVALVERADPLRLRPPVRAL